MIIPGARHTAINEMFTAAGRAWIVDVSEDEWMLAWNPEIGEVHDRPGSDALLFCDGARWRQPLLSNFSVNVEKQELRFKAAYWHQGGGESTMVPLTIAEARKRGGDLGKLVETFDPANPEHQAYFLMEFRP